MTMSFHSGLAASSGVRAARLAARGFTADPQIFDGAMSFGAVFSREWSPEALIENLKGWEAPFMIVSPGPTFKLYPCGRPTLFGVDCVVELQRKHQVKPADVRRITCDVSYMYPRTPPERTPAFLSVHVPSVAETRDLIDAAALRRMKRGAFLINTSRAAIINREALLDAIASGHLGEMWLLSELAAWLRAQGRSRFFLSAPPLRLPGAVGSPANPIATV